MPDFSIINGNVLLPDGMRPCDLHVAGGRLSDRSSGQENTFDAEGGLVLPGIVDLHGDAFERAIEPRPKVTFDIAAALHDVDRQLVSNGITTAFHALTVSWETGLRSAETAEKIFRAISDEAFKTEIFPHFRWETYAFDEAEQVLSWLEDTPHALLSINDHTTAYLALTLPSSKLDRLAARLGTSVEEALERLNALARRKNDVDGTLAKVCSRAGDLSVPILSHDDRSTEDRHLFRSHGASICEFPMTLDVAREAREEGEAIILGAPNVVRGGSQNGAVDARGAIDSGLCTVLVSDYHYPSLMKAAFDLAGTDLNRLAEVWPLVSSAPAHAAKLNDRGELSPGSRADLLVFWPGTTNLRAVFVNGNKVLEYG